MPLVLDCISVHIWSMCLGLLKSVKFKNMLKCFPEVDLILSNTQFLIWHGIGLECYPGVHLRLIDFLYVRFQA